MAVGKILFALQVVSNTRQIMYTNARIQHRRRRVRVVSWIKLHQEHISSQVPVSLLSHIPAGHVDVAAAFADVGSEVVC